MLKGGRLLDMYAGEINEGRQLNHAEEMNEPTSPALQTEGFPMRLSGSRQGWCRGTDISSMVRTSPPRASSNSACLVFLLPSFIPPVLKRGVRDAAAGAGDVVRAVGVSGASYRGTDA